jgi:hypothetical protein
VADPKSLSSVGRVARDMGMVQVRDVRLSPRLREMRELVHQRVGEARVDGELESLHPDDESPTALSFFPEITDLFETRPAHWLEEQFGVPRDLRSVGPDHPISVPAQSVDVLPLGHVDAMHFAEVYGMASLAGLNVYAGSGKTLIQKILFSRQPDKQAVERYYGDFFENEGMFALAQTPILLVDLTSRGDHLAAQWAQYEVQAMVNFSLRYLNGKYSSRDDLPQFAWARPTVPDFFAGLFLSPAIRDRLLEIRDGKDRLHPLDTLGGFYNLAVSAMHAHGVYPRPHFPDRNGAFEGSLATTFGFELYGFKHSAWPPLFRRAAHIFYHHLAIPQSARTRKFLEEQDRDYYLMKPFVQLDERNKFSDSSLPTEIWDQYLRYHLLQGNPEEVVRWVRRTPVLRDAQLHEALSNVGPGYSRTLWDVIGG